jgi:CBS domain containing-hemolysin-like protein
LAGFILEIHGRFPRKQEIITFSKYAFKVELMDKKRIKQVKVTIDREFEKE